MVYREFLWSRVLNEFTNICSFYSLLTHIHVYFGALHIVSHVWLPWLIIHMWPEVVSCLVLVQRLLVALPRVLFSGDSFCILKEMCRYDQIKTVLLRYSVVVTHGNTLHRCFHLNLTCEITLNYWYTVFDWFSLQGLIVHGFVPNLIHNIWFLQNIEYRINSLRWNYVPCHEFLVWNEVPDNPLIN